MTEDACSEPESLVAILSDDHVELGALLMELLRSLDEANVDEAYARLDTLWARLAVHIRAENVQVFPDILRALDAQTATGRQDVKRTARLRASIERLRSDHDVFMSELKDAVKAVRTVSDDRDGKRTPAVFRSLRDRLGALEGVFENHNREEDSVYPMAASVLDSAEMADLMNRVRRELAALPPRLRDELGW
ncbi:MAG: hemerythrin domain-containing protein [Blastocatellia bacterium]|jgi:hemerythrin-like domain-containing protein|nr:hemerythrin domain-containing protein [Blastocatellia bacterium]